MPAAQLFSGATVGVGKKDRFLKCLLTKERWRGGKYGECGGENFSEMMEKKLL